MVAFFVAWALTPPQQLKELEFKVPQPYFAGEREVVLGPKAYSDSVMALIYSKDYPAKLDMKGVNPPIWDEYPIGSIRWSVKPDVFGSQQCMVLKMEATYRPQFRFKVKYGARPNDVTLDIRGVSQWWIAEDGTILRQFEQRADNRGTQSANCTYGKDSIEVSVDMFGQRRVTTLYPGDMDKLQAQFKPMIVDGKVVMREKEYLIYNPFTSGFDKRKATLSGAFKGVYLSANFEGTSMTLEGYEDGPFRAFISNEGDLVKMELPKDRYLVLQSLPPARQAKKDAGG